MSAVATEVSELDLPELDYTESGLHGDRFHERMGELRRSGWLARHPLGIIVLEREAGEFFLRSKSVGFPMSEIAEIFGITDGPLREEMRRNIIGLEGDDHRRVRSVVNQFFTPRAADAHREAIRGILEELVAPIRGAGRCEFVGAVARPFPAKVIGHLLGRPDADPDALARWSTVVQGQFDALALAAGREEIERQVLELYAFLSELIEEKSADPGEDLVSNLLMAEKNGERLPPEDVLNLVGNVLIGGIDTLQSQLSQAVRLFAQHPDQWALLASDPDLAPAAVEEALRFEPVTPFTARIVREEIVYRDVVFPPGSVVLVGACTANRDGGSDQHTFDISAERESRILTFGAGIHYCLGANLARAELEEAFKALAVAMPGLRLDGDPDFDTVTGIYGLHSLPIAFDS